MSNFLDLRRPNCGSSESIAGDNHERLRDALLYIAGHAAMAYHHANQRGWYASLKNIEHAALHALERLEREGGAP